MLILSKKQYFKKYFEENNFENDLYLFINDFGYFNDKIRV